MSRDPVADRVAQLRNTGLFSDSPSDALDLLVTQAALLAVQYPKLLPGQLIERCENLEALARIARPGSARLDIKPRPPPSERLDALRRMSSRPRTPSELPYRLPYNLPRRRGLVAAALAWIRSPS